MLHSAYSVFHNLLAFTHAHSMASKPHRLSTCHRHPSTPVTGFCASCLRERLAGISSPVADKSLPLPLPELRRTKSCSGSRDASSSSSLAAEPRRRSCEVRARSTLSDLFTVADEKKKRPNPKLEVEEVHDNVDEEPVRFCDGRDEVAEEETKTMKEFIDLELQSRKPLGRDLRSFWDAASVFGEKLRKWKWKHKLKKKRASCGDGGNGNENGSVSFLGFNVEKQRGRRLRETQSEVGEYGLRRRSCDTDPRLSIDAGRISVDYDPRFSFEAPRASWDGCLIGTKLCHRLSPMVSVVEDENDRVLVEMNDEKNNVDSSSPGGSAQTKDYYSRRRSFDRSSSHRRQSIADVDELKLLSNAKVSPATTELFYGAKLLITEKHLSDVKSDCVLGSASKDGSDVVANGVAKKGSKKFHKWRKVWNKLGLVQQRREDRMGEVECDEGVMVNKPLAESWQKLRRVVNVQASESVSQKLIRSYSVSCRTPCRMAGLTNGLGAPEAKGNILNGRQDVMLQRNRSARYSPSNADTGLLRFYLTPLKSHRRTKSVKSGLKDLHPIARSVM